MAILVGWSVFSAMGCSLRYDFSECETTGDCARIENPETDRLYQCVQNECVPRAASVPDARSDAEDAIEADAQDADTDNDDSLACTTTQYCLDEFGDSFYCTPAGECMDTASELCDPIYYPNSDRGEVVLLGSIIPTQGEAYAALGATIKNAVRMAVIEYTSNALTLPGGATVAHLHCEGGSPEIARASAEHLRALGTPVTIGPLTSSSFIEVIQHVAVPTEDAEGVMTPPMGAIAMGATASSIANLDAIGQYAFQIIPQDTMQASAIVDRTHNLRWRSCVMADGDDECTDDSSCQANPLLGDDYVYDATKPATPCKDTAPKIAVFYKDDQYGNGLHDLFVDRYFDRYDDAEVKYYKYPDPASLDFDETRIRSQFTTIAMDALGGEDAQPDSDIVVFVGTGEATSLAKLYVGALGQIDQPAITERRYLFSHGAASDVPGLFEEGSTALPESLLPLFEAIAPNIFNEPLYSKWQNRYALTFDEPARTSVGGLAYDAAYMGIFAMAGVPDDQIIDGENVTNVLEAGRLQNPDGLQINLEGVTFPGEARNALRDGDDLDLTGVTGTLDFVVKEDKNQGTVRSDYLGFRVGDANNDEVLEIIPTRAYILAEGEDFGQWAPLPDAP